MSLSSIKRGRGLEPIVSESGQYPAALYYKQELIYPFKVYYLPLLTGRSMNEFLSEHETKCCDVCDMVQIKIVYHPIKDGSQSYPKLEMIC